jgi:hypothetical protein
MGTRFPNEATNERQKMKVLTKVLVVSGILTLVSGFASQAQSAKHREITRYISAPGGTYIGSGNASTYLTNIRAKTMGHENPQLRHAINSLDGLGMIDVRGYGLLPAAVAWQCNSSIHKVVAEQAETRLSYGELLMAHALAAESNHDLNKIIAMRIHTRTWGQLAAQLGISEALIVRRANTASDRIRTAEMRSRQRAERDPSLQTTNPNLHHYYAHH